MLFHLFISVILMAQSYQTQPYEVVSTIDQIEIRYYPPAMKVQVESTSSNNRNFNALFQYISGNNDKEKIAMTTPVYMENKKGSQTMAFVLPAQYTNAAPQPKGDGVEVFNLRQATLPPYVTVGIQILEGKAVHAAINEYLSTG